MTICINSRERWHTINSTNDQTEESFITEDDEQIKVTTPEEEENFQKFQSSQMGRQKKIRG